MTEQEYMQNTVKSAAAGFGTQLAILGASPELIKNATAHYVTTQLQKRASVLEDFRTRVGVVLSVMKQIYG